MIVKLMIPVLFFQFSLAQSSLQSPLECKNPRSKICLLQVVSMIGFEVPKFPDLSEKHTLLIRSGDIAVFNENITSQFGGVTKVTLGRMNIEVLYIPANWVSLNAESNQIRELIVKAVNDDSSNIMVGDESYNSTEDTQNVSTTGKTVEPTTVSSIGNEDPIDVKGVNTTESLTVSTNENAKQINNKSDPEHTLDPLKNKIEVPPASKTPAKIEEVQSAVFNAVSLVEPEETTEYRTEIVPVAENVSTTEKQESIKAKPDEVTPSPSGYRLETLNLANNKLQSIRELKYMVNLKELRLDGNELEFIEMATFDGMTKLRKLSLSKNKINHISSPMQTNLPALEWLSLAFNRLAKLQVINWNMLQLVELDVSHNMLVKLDVDNFDQFVSLEKLAVANNSWTCHWLNEALKEISKRDFITLIDRNDDPRSCPNGLPVEGICCSLTVHDDDESNSENLHERMQRFQKEQDSMNIDLKGRIRTFEQEWNGQWAIVNRDVTAMRKQIDAKEKEPNDDSKVTEKDLKELNQLIDDSNKLLSEMEQLNKDNSFTAGRLAQSLYTTIDLKNKLFAAMRTSAQLKNDLHQYEISFKAEVK